MRVGNSVNPPVEVSMAVPEGWYVKESWTVLAPDGQANVIISSEPLDPSITTEEYASMQGALLSREFPNFHQHSFGDFTLVNGVVAKLRVFEWTPPDGMTVTQLQIYYLIGGRGITSTATTPSVQYSRFSATFFETMRSVAVAHHPSAAW